MDLCDYDASSFAFGIRGEMGSRNAEFDNGIVVLYKPKTNDKQRTNFYSNGIRFRKRFYADAISKRIVEETEMIPLF